MNGNSLIGIDLGAHSIKAAQNGPDGTPLVRLRVPRRDPGSPVCADDIARLAGVLYRQGASGRRVAVAAPKPIINRLTMDLPPLDSGAPIEQIVRAEVARQRHDDSQDFECRWDETPQPPRHAAGARAIVSSCAHAGANEILDLFEEAGLEPVALHDPAVCLASLATNSQSPRVIATLDLGWTDATFTAVKGGRIRFIRSITACGLESLVGDERWLADAISEIIARAHRPEEEHAEASSEFDALYKRYRSAIASEVGSSIRYLEGCSDEESPSEIRVCGGGAALPGVVSVLHAETERPVHRAGTGGPCFAIASALAAHGIAGSAATPKGAAA